MRTYTVVEGNGEPDMVYQGFDRNFHNPRPKCIAVYMVDGDVETWALDNVQSNEQLIQYLDDMDVSYSLVGIYT